jgi:carboxyl-terminal processing protease
MGVVAGLAIWAGCQTGRMAPPPSSLAASLAASLATNSLEPGPDDPRIAFVAARVLENYNYMEKPLDKEMSAKFYDGYIDSLDPHHEYFLQSDVAEFAPYRTNLDRLTINSNGVADLSPAFRIFHRFQERFAQRIEYAEELLQQDKFKFNTDERISDRRHDSPFPKDLDEAREIWRQHVRFDYLQEKLAKEFSESNGVFTIKLPPGATTNIIADLEKRNRLSLHQLTNQDSGNVLGAYLNALAHAYDPHSDYMGAERAQDFAISMNLSLFGIGAQLKEDDGYCTINMLVAGGPAIKSKLINEKDRILAVAQSNQPPVDVVDMDLGKVVQQIRGPKGTEVRLTVSPFPNFNAPKVVTLVRDEIKLEDGDAKAKIIDLPDAHGGTNRIGILDLPSFYAPVDTDNGHATPRYTSVDVAKLLKKLKREHIAGLIVDLRFNPGGSLEEAIKFTGLFIKDGPVVLARDPGLDGQIRVDSCTDSDQLYGGPLVVMVNRFSASAAEIAAAALQDYGRAVIVGDVSTHGKGTVQSLQWLKPFMNHSTNNPGEVKVTIKKFYRVSGASTQLKGVTPDLVLPEVFSYWSMVGESNLDNPLPWDTIQPAKYDKLNLVQPYLADLRARSDARVATNRDFDYNRQDIAQYEKTQAERSATLNENEALKERKQDSLKAQARNKEQQARPDPGLKLYELTLQNSADPGLPAPKPYLTTNFDASTPVSSYCSYYVVNGRTNWLSQAPVSQHPEQVVYIYTNFFTPAYITGFTSYLHTNYASVPDAAFVYTNSKSTNIIAEYDHHLSATNQTVQTFTPSVSRSSMPDPLLEESERILEDYISLLPKGGSLTVNP